MPESSESRDPVIFEHELPWQRRSSVSEIHGSRGRPAKPLQHGGESFVNVNSPSSPEVERGRLSVERDIRTDLCCNVNCESLIDEIGTPNRHLVECNSLTIGQTLDVSYGPSREVAIGCLTTESDDQTGMCDHLCNCEHESPTSGTAASDCLNVECSRLLAGRVKDMCPLRLEVTPDRLNVKDNNRTQACSSICEIVSLANVVEMNDCLPVGSLRTNKLVKAKNVSRSEAKEIGKPTVGSAKSAAPKSPSGKLNLRKQLRIGTWNVRTLNRTGQIELLALEAERLSMDVLGLAETNMTGKGITELDGGQILIVSGQERISTRGVGVWLSKRAASAMLGYNPISERIMTVRLQATPFNLTFIECYAPTNSATDEDKEWFYDQLRETLTKVPNGDVVLIGGDFNAKLGAENPAGKHAPGELNENGEMLTEFCMSNDFLAANAMVARHPRRTSTWHSPDGKVKNQIDFILVPKRWFSSLTKCRAFPSANLPNCDHLLVAGNLHLKLKVQPKQCHKTKMVFSKQGLVDYQIDVSNRFASLVEENAGCDSSPDSQWGVMKEVIQTSANKTLTVRACPKKSWISMETMDLIEAKRKLTRGEADHRTLSRQVKQAVKKDRKAVLTETCRSIEEAGKRNDSKGMFNLLNRFTRKVAPKCSNIRGMDGKLLTEATGILGRWHSYCADLYKGGNDTTAEEISLPYSVGDEPAPLYEEVERALKSIHAGKAAGPDEVPIELLQNGGMEVTRRLHGIIVSVWTTGKWPKEWCASTVVPILKKGDPTKCENYRTLSLVSHASKVLLNVILERIRGKMESETADEQAGFRRGRGTQNHLVSLKVMMEKARAKKAPLHFCFVDMQRAFDSVPHGKLWRALRELGFSEQVIALIKNLYDNGTSRVRIAGRTSAAFETRIGTRQGCPLSPYLFNIFAEVMMRITLENFEGGMRIGGIRVSNLRYADDIVLVAETAAELQELVSKMQGACEEMGLAINVAKTSSMSLNTDARAMLEVYGELVPYSDRFTYLGALFSADSTGSMEFRRRLSLGNSRLAQLEPVLRRRDLSDKLKVKVVQALVFPVVTYGCEAWNLNCRESAMLNAFETKSYRRAMNITYHTHTKNSAVFQRAGTESTLVDSVMRRKLRYFAHVARHSSIEQSIIVGGTPGRRTVGGQRRKWIDDITRWVAQRTDKKRVSVPEVFSMAQERGNWRHIASLRKSTLVDSLDDLR
jgi:Reverse transcriptase (RNA-dependent DNA polymerase)